MAKDEETEYEGGWGTEKADYYNADVVETEQDAQEEEAEARRLQQKHLEGLSETDFGFDNLEDAEADGEAPIDDDDRRDVVTETIPHLQLTENTSRADRLKLLHTLYPEFEHLRKEYVRLQPALEELQPPERRTTKAAHTRWLALSAYVGCLGMYFALLASPADGQRPSSTITTILPPQKVRSHPIMGRLVKCHEMWSLVEDSQELLEEADALEAANAENQQSRMEVIDVVPADTQSDKKRKRKLSRAERAAQAAAEEAEAQRKERIRKTQEDLADLSTLLKKPTKSIKTASSAVAMKPTDDDDFGDESALTAEEAAEKARERKSLRFYTSQIAQKANKRERKGMMAGGDDDIPYRERFRDRQARTMDNPEDRYTRKQVEESGSEDVDNDLTQIKPVKRRRDDDQQQDAAKRAINYEIEKNKGLTPHRKKEVRNPRVKKRMKYEEKKKKLGSRRAIYKGGEGRGGYKGELTGINTSVVKSIKL